MHTSSVSRVAGKILPQTGSKILFKLEECMQSNLG